MPNNFEKESRKVISFADEKKKREAPAAPSDFTISDSEFEAVKNLQPTPTLARELLDQKSREIIATMELSVESAQTYQGLSRADMSDDDLAHLLSDIVSGYRSHGNEYVLAVAREYILRRQTEGKPYL